MFRIKKDKKGFTLIELLVVIAIIGILAGIVLVSLGGARKKARDAKRMSDIRQTATAMEMQYSDNEQYLSTTVDTTTGTLAVTAIGTYLDPIPKDPGGGATTNCNAAKDTPYKAWANSTDLQQYCIWACLESGKFFASSEKGTKEMTAAPTALPCW